MRRFTGKSAQVARILLIVATVVGVALLAVGAGFTVARRAQAASYDVCASGCTFNTIQDAINNTNGTPSNPAIPLTTIKVGPGTYNEHVNITRTLTLQGANVGIDPNTTTRSAESIINAGGSATSAITISAANVTIDGFTLTGASAGVFPSAGIYGTSASGNTSVLNNIITGNSNGIIDIKGSTVTVEYNHIYDNTTGASSTCSTSPPTTRCNGIFELINFTKFILTNNVIDQSDVNHYQRAMNFNPTNPTQNTGVVQIENNTIKGMCTFTYLTGDFENNTYTGGPFGLKLGGAIANFSIIGNTFSGLYTSAVMAFSSYHSGGETNLTISYNTVIQDVAVLQPGWIYSSPDVATFDLDYLNGTATVSHNTIIYSGTMPTGASVEAVHLRSHVTGNVSIDSNVFFGGGVGGADTDGILLDSDIQSPTVTNNLIRQFVYGVNDQTGAVFTFGANNCIASNSSYGYSATGPYANAGDMVNVEQNWWGAANGPAPSGSGNPITSHVDATNYLTSAPSFCAGPVTSNVQSSVNPLPLMVPFTLTAHLTTTGTSHQPVANAYYTIDAGSPTAMSTSAGFTYGVDETMDVTANLPAFTSVGSYKVCVYGVDTFGDVGDPTCITLDVTTADTTTTITSSVNPSDYGQSVTFTITVAASTGTPTGDVTLKEGATTLAGPLTLNGSSQATFTTASLSVGSHALTAYYAGDASGTPIFAPSTSSVYTQVVNKANTTTVVTASPNPAVSGQTVTLAVHVVGAFGTVPTGSVTLKDGATTLGSVTLDASGNGSLTSSSLSVGTHNITATYPGDPSHNGSTGYGAATVTATPSVPTGAKNAYIRIVQASESYATSDIAIDGKVTFPNVAACTAQSYYPVSAGNHTFTLATPSGGSVILSKNVNLVAGEYYTFGVVGNAAHSISPNFVIFVDDLSVTPNQAKVRVYHFSDTLGSVKVSSGASVVAASLPFKSATGYTSQTPGTVTYTIAPMTGPALTDTLSVSANQVYSIFLMCNGQVANAATVGVPQSLPQTGNGPQMWLAWLTPTLLTLLLIAGAILLLGGSVGLGSYYVIARRRGSSH